MSNSRLALLFVVAAATLGIAILMARSPQDNGRDLAGPTHLIQGLDIEMIHSIELSDSKGKTTLVRSGKGFTVVDKDNYPADNKQINELFTNCLDIKTTARVSSDPKNHADLEVTEEKAKYVVKFLKEDGSLLGGVVVGKSKEDSAETYVRLVNQNDVYLTDRSPYIRLEAIDYVDKEICNVKEADVLKVHSTSPTGMFVLDANEGPDDIHLVNIPANKRLKNSEAKLVLGALSSFRISDVAKGPRTDLEFTRKFVCELKNGIVYSLSLADEKDQTFMTCSAQYVGEKVSMDTGKVDSPEELKAKEARLLAHETAITFQKKHENWVYTLPSWKANALKKDLGNLLEDVVPPAPAPAPVPATDAGAEDSTLAPFINLPDVPDANVENPDK